MEFTFKNYKLFCYDFNLKADRYKNLKIFKEYCSGNYDIIFKIRGDYNERKFACIIIALLILVFIGIGILFLLELKEFYNEL